MDLKGGMQVNVIELKRLRTKRIKLAYLRHPDLCIKLFSVKPPLLVIVCRSLYERTLEFDSDKLDLQEFDWNDVKQVRGARIFSIRLAGPITVDGLLRITEDKVIVTKGDEQQEFDRDQLFAIAAKAEKRIDIWSGKISLGCNFSSGNTDQT